MRDEHLENLYVDDIENFFDDYGGDDCTVFVYDNQEFIWYNKVVMGILI